jgi:hypothetical protein
MTHVLTILAGTYERSWHDVDGSQSTGHQKDKYMEHRSSHLLPDVLGDRTLVS